MEGVTWSSSPNIPVGDTGPTADIDWPLAESYFGGILHNHQGISIGSSKSSGLSFDGITFGMSAYLDITSELQVGGTCDIQGNTFDRASFRDYAEAVSNTYNYDVGTPMAAVIIDWTYGNVQQVSVTGGGAGVAGIFPILNAPATGDCQTIQLHIQNGGLLDYSGTDLVYNGKWAGGTQPALSTDDKIDIISIMTIDNGETNYCFLNGEGMTS